MQLVVGRIGRAHGVRGDLFVEPMTDSPEVRFADGSTLKTSDHKTLTVSSSKWHSGRFVVHFKGIDDRTAAESIRGIQLIVEVDPTELPDDPDEFYDHQLVGLTAFIGEQEIGKVTEVIHLPAQDLLAIKKSDGAEALVPFVTEFVPVVDVQNKRVELTPPPGLIDEEDAIVVREEAGETSK